MLADAASSVETIPSHPVPKCAKMLWVWTWAKNSKLPWNGLFSRTSALALEAAMAGRVPWRQC